METVLKSTGHIIMGVFITAVIINCVIVAGILIAAGYVIIQIHG